MGLGTKRSTSILAGSGVGRGRDGGRFSNEKDLSNSHIAKHIRVTQDQGKLMVRFRFRLDF